MGGAVHTLLGVLATIGFALAGHPFLATLAALVVLIVCGSWLLMHRISRQIARDRQYVAALETGLFEHNTPESEEYWQNIRPVVTPRDISHVPNGIATLHMLAALVALGLLIWAGIAIFT